MYTGVARYLIKLLFFFSFYLSLLTSTELSLGGSSPNTSTDKTNTNKYTWRKQFKNIVQTIQNTEMQVHILSKHPHNYQNTHTIIKTPSHTLTYRLKTS